MLKSLFQNKDIWRKIGFSLIVLVLFRAIAAVPLPGIPTSALKELLTASSFFQMISLMSGGLLDNIGILTIGLGPYINASYIFQLLSVVLPQVKELYQGGPIERRMLTMYTRLLAVPLAIIQAVVIFTLLSRLGFLGGQPSELQIVATIALLTFGAIFSMWLGELITEFGLGGGTSLIILTGILVSLPIQLQSDLQTILDPTRKGLLIGMIVVLLLIAVIITLSVRKIRLIYARRVRPSGLSTVQNYLPVSINTAGVMPVIFAISIIDVPRIGFTFIQSQTANESLKKIADSVVTFLSNTTYYDILLVTVTVFFTFLSAYIVFKPSEAAENINKQGGFIEGIRPGKQTEQFLNMILWTTTFWGALLLAIITVLPSFAVQQFELPRQIITGTGAIIMASVVMDVIRQVQALMVSKTDIKKYY